MKIISWNVNGIRACMRNGFVEVLAQLDPDIILLQEIKIDDAARAQHDFDLPAYEEYWYPAERKGYSGTAILSKKPISVTNGFGWPEYDGEGRVQTADAGDFWVVNAYFPNSRGDLSRLGFKEKFNEVLLGYLKELEKTKPVIIGGDFNVAREEIDLARPKENTQNPGFTKEERYWGREYLKSGLIDSFRYLHPDKIQYSWWSYRALARVRNIGWRIDYFFVSEILAAKLKSAIIYDELKGSDHCPIGVEL
ncbi:MAG: exodeoxyribonuclease III [Candidatus Falkowbacteria bacterium]